MTGIVEWNYKNLDREKVIELATKCSIPFVSAAIMYVRGIVSKENVLTFLKDTYFIFFKAYEHVIINIKL